MREQLGLWGAAQAKQYGEPLETRKFFVSKLARLMWGCSPGLVIHVCVQQMQQGQGRHGRRGGAGGVLLVGAGRQRQAMEWAGTAGMCPLCAQSGGIEEWRSSDAALERLLGMMMAAASPGSLAHRPVMHFGCTTRAGPNCVVSPVHWLCFLWQLHQGAAFP